VPGPRRDPVLRQEALVKLRLLGTPRALAFLQTVKGTLGIVGLGTMGRNLALNVESRGFPVAVWNREQDWTDAFVAEHGRSAFTGSLDARGVRPRRSSARGRSS
jgi:hypothetical protein